MATQMGTDIQENLEPILHPLYRVNENTKDLKLKEICQEILEIIKTQIGANIFFEAYNLIRNKILDIRQKRKQARSIMLLDPEIAQKNREKKAARAKTKRQRVIKEYSIMKDKHKIKVARTWDREDEKEKQEM